MAKQITLDGIKKGGLNLHKDAAGTLKVEANYQIMAGPEAVKTVGRDITSLLTSDQKASLSDAYDTVFNRIESSELS